jgi:hypothetical protein
MDGARGIKEATHRSDRHKQEREQMKRKGAEGIPARQRLTPAANEEFTEMVDDLNGHDLNGHDLDLPGLDRLTTPRSGWDPYEVWRTRVKASAKEKRGREPLR